VGQIRGSPQNAAVPPTIVAATVMARILSGEALGAGHRVDRHDAPENPSSWQVFVSLQGLVGREDRANSRQLLSLSTNGGSGADTRI
jgi:hypothetical protein